MMRNRNRARFSLLAACALALTGCGGSAASSTDGGSNRSSSNASSSGKKADITISEYTGDDTNDDIEFEHISGSTYEGWMMYVHNPKDISVEVNPSIGSPAPSLDEYIKDFNAVAGINAGGFIDVGGHGDGSIPQGVVIHKGELVYGNANDFTDLIGITSDNKLVAAGTTAQQALDWGVTEGVTFGPVLINNYEDVFDHNTTNLAMLNPRTAIGQSTDGTFMLLVLDGRGPSSFGALYDDMIKIFQDHDAVTAANLDGGNSSAMIYNGEYVNNTVSMYGSRNLPTAILVKEGQGNN